MQTNNHLQSLPFLLHPHPPLLLPPSLTGCPCRIKACHFTAAHYLVLSPRSGFLCHRNPGRRKDKTFCSSICCDSITANIGTKRRYFPVYSPERIRQAHQYTIISGQFTMLLDYNGEGYTEVSCRWYPLLHGHFVWGSRKRNQGPCNATLQEEECTCAWEWRKKASGPFQTHWRGNATVGSSKVLRHSQLWIIFSAILPFLFAGSAHVISSSGCQTLKNNEDKDELHDTPSSR